MFVYVWNDLTATTSGSVSRDYECESCGGGYRCQLEKTVSSTWHSPLMLFDKWAQQQAQKSAKQRLLTALETEHPSVPCPHCGRYQEAMFPALRQSLYRWMSTAGLLLLIGSPGAVFVGMLATAAVNGKDLGGIEGFLIGVVLVVITAAAGVILLLARRVLQHRYDPNEQIPERKRFAIARRDAVSLAKRMAPFAEEPQDAGLIILEGDLPDVATGDRVRNERLEMVRRKRL